MPVMLPATLPRLVGPRVHLRRPVLDDIEGRRRLGQDPAIIRAFGGSPGFDEPRPLTMADAEAWYRRHAVRPDALCWFVEHDGRFIGTTKLVVESEADRRARFTIGILDATLLGQGLGTEITQLVLAFGFEVVGLHRISLRVLATNQRARRCYLRCGFVEEGIERESVLIDGIWHDDVRMALLNHEHAAGARRPTGR